jgi:ornithine cyclodeaminase/alanine dehydrogenase-like protein (mu-crystallin family)
LLFKSVGMALQDLAAARLAFSRLSADKEAAQASHSFQR